MTTEGKKMKKLSKKSLLGAAIVAVILVLLCCVWLFWPKPVATGPRPENTVDYSAPTQEQKEAGSKAKEDFLNNDSKATGDTPPAETVGTSITITSSNVSDGVLQLRAMLTSATADGVCTLTMTKSGANDVVQTAGIQQMGSYDLCKGFNVVTADMARGEWNVTIKYSGAGGATGTAQTKVTL